MKKIISLLLTAFLALSFASVCSAATEVKNDGSWQISATSDIGNTIARAIDGDDATFWHSNYTAEDGKITRHDECPHIITIDFGKEMTLSGWRYNPRPGNSTGAVTEYNIYSSEDGKAFKKIFTGKFDYTWQDWADGKRGAPSEASWGDTKMRAVKIEITSSIGGYGTAAEITFLKGSGGTKNGDGAVFVEAKKEEHNTLSKTGWQIKASSEVSWGLAENMIDGTTKKIWHSNYTAEGQTITSTDEPPYTIELTLPKAMASTGLLYTPRQDGSTGRWMTADVYVSSDGKTKGDKVGTIKGEQTSTDEILLPFGKELSVKKVTIEVTETSGGKIGSCAELDLVAGETWTGDGKKDDKKDDSNYPEAYLDPAGWEVTSSSEASWGSVKKAFDNNLDTVWHTNYKNEGTLITGHDMPPFTIDITLPEKKAISGFKIIGRTSDTNGRVKGYELYASETDGGEMTLVSKDEISGSTSDEVNYGIAFEAKKLKFVVTEGQGGYGCMAELQFKKAGENEKIYPVTEFAEALDSVALKKIDPSGFKAENDLPVWGGNSTKNLFDGAAAYWQTEEVPVGTDSTVLRIDLGKVYTFSAVSIYPRQSNDLHGYWEQFNMWAGTSDDDMTELLHDYSFGERTLNEKMITFEKPVTARYVEFEITKFLSGRISCAEISFWQTKEEREASGGTGKFVMQIGSNEIKVTKGGVESVKTIDTSPFITSAGRTLIPLRGLIEEMGAEIEWTDENQSITINNNGIKLYLQIRNNLVYVDSPAYGHIMYTLESEPRIKDSRTFVPLRFISEQFGYNVSWDGETKTITIEK